MRTDIFERIKEHQEITKRIIEDEKTMKKIFIVTEKIVECYKNGNKLLLCGNGGSAADCQHIAGELVGRFKREREGLPCIALTTDTSIITAWGNDYGFDTIYSRQIEALGSRNDVLIAISTSGTSPNIINAVRKAKEKGLFTIGFSGESGGRLKDCVDVLINIPSNNTPRIQEAHILISHIICELVEEKLFE